MSLIGIIASQNYPRSIDVVYLVVAGGGGSGHDYTAGAGAGGFRTGTLTGITLGADYTCTIGAGGAGASSGSDGAAGSSSIFNSTTWQHSK
jgi:hypothetical protein